jgi:two-component system, chemotaxis family, response regulator Rcp1
MMNARPIDILLIEDNPGDVRLAREALRESQVPNTLHVIGDGETAMAYLRREGEHVDACRPDVILLDLNLPKRDGREVLADVKGSPELRRIPVVVLTTSQAEADILKSYDLHANCYIQKPIDFAQFVDVMRSIEDFWFTTVKLPRG